MLRSLLRPGALVSHVLVLAVAAVCVWAGQWQLERLDQRRDSNERLEANLAAEPLRIADLVGRDLDEAELEYRRVELTGTYLPDDELVLEGRQFQGQGGRDVLTPLLLDDTSAPRARADSEVPGARGDTLVLVRRGWVPRSLGDPPLADAAPPTGQVTVEGYLERSVPQPTGLGPRNPEEGELDVLQVPDLPRIAPQLDGTLFPMLVRLTTQDPPPIASEAVAATGMAALPAIPDVAPFDEANHLSYALQWHSFALLAVIAYAFWWRRRLREEADEGHDAGRPGDAPTPGAERVTSPRAGTGQPPL